MVDDFGSGPHRGPNPQPEEDMSQLKKPTFSRRDQQNQLGRIYQRYIELIDAYHNTKERMLSDKDKSGELVKVIQTCVAKFKEASQGDSTSQTSFPIVEGKKISRRDLGDAGNSLRSIEKKIELPIAGIIEAPHRTDLVFHLNERSNVIYATAIIGRLHVDQAQLFKDGIQTLDRISKYLSLKTYQIEEMTYTRADKFFIRGFDITNKKEFTLRIDPRADDAALKKAIEEVSLNGSTER